MNNNWYIYTAGRNESDCLLFLFGIGIFDYNN